MSLWQKDTIVNRKDCESCIEKLSIKKKEKKSCLSEGYLGQLGSVVSEQWPGWHSPCISHQPQALRETDLKKKNDLFIMVSY